tara:strand:- start:85 stop:336 length:252 start_codon:yes stop_codon:yes gene_type:complete
MDYTITLTDTQVKALEWVAADPRNWIANAAEARAQVAISNILPLLTAHCNEKGIQLAVGEAAQVTQAYDLGVITKFGSTTSTK